MTKDYYYHDVKCPEFKLVNNSVNDKLLPKEILEKRPAKTELPKYLAEAGNLQFEFLLDFGSFRDLQRHRAIVQRMPLLTIDIGFEKWYLAELPEELRGEAESFLKTQEEKINKLNISKEDTQYYIAMGYKVSNRVTGNIASLGLSGRVESYAFCSPDSKEKSENDCRHTLRTFWKNWLGDAHG